MSLSYNSSKTADNFSASCFCFMWSSVPTMKSITNKLFQLRKLTDLKQREKTNNEINLLNGYIEVIKKKQ